MNAVLFALNAKYIHSSLAPWCLLAGVEKEKPEQVAVVVREGTINEKESDVLNRILDCAPQVVCFSCYLWNIRQTLRLAQQVKQQCPQVWIVLGGPEVSYNAAQVLRENPQVDYILSGEGETSVPMLLECLAKGEDPAACEPQIPGLCARVGDSVLEREPCVLTQIPPSPYSQQYLHTLNGRIAYLETSRGCPYSCAFCLSGRCGKPRFFPLEQAYQDIITLANSGAQTVKLIDRTFNANVHHADAILSFILEHYGREIPEGICFHFELAGDILRESTFALLEKAPPGAFQLEIGMQSFCEKTLAAVRRKTDCRVLQDNIRRLVAMGNMHVHIDLIAGLPYEDLAGFGESFNTGYALGAQMMQLGFLKLLHGAAMREEPEEYPCEFSPEPPYEVIRTPWITPKELDVLRSAEDALERCYNSGRFRGTVAYVLRASEMTPFEFYCRFGAAASRRGTANIPLDEYTQLLYEWCAALPGVEQPLLRDAMVCDRLTTNSSGRLPHCLHVADPMLGKMVRMLAADPQTAPKPGVKRGAAILYGARKAAFVDYTQKNPVTGRYLLHTRSIDNFCVK